MITALYVSVLVLTALFAILCIKTADVWRSYRAARKTDAHNLRKREYEMALEAFTNVLREAALRRAK